jgi:hypothetical protein
VASALLGGSFFAKYLTGNIKAKPAHHLLRKTILLSRFQTSVSKVEGHGAQKLVSFLAFPIPILRF